MYKLTISGRIVNFIISVILLSIAFAFVYPFIYILFASFSDPFQLSQHTGFLYRPLGFTLKGYDVAVSYSGIWTGYINTLIIVVLGSIINMILTIIGAYVLSRKDLFFYKFLNLFIIFTMFFSGGLIPFYLVVSELGLGNTYWALILPVAINTWNLIILRTAISSIPPSLIESARIDGANDFLLLFRIVVPLVGATLAVLVLFYVVGHWNSWFNAFLFIRDRSLFPMQLVLREILIQNTGGGAAHQGTALTEMNLYRHLVQYCTTVIATVPVLIIFPFLQKHFVKGVLIGSVKG